MTNVNKKQRVNIFKSKIMLESHKSFFIKKIMYQFARNNFMNETFICLFVYLFL